jgi:hypothetical protein
MGTAMRFVVGLAGLLIFCIGLGVTGSILSEVIASPWDIDFPGGPLIPTMIALLAGAAPLTGGFWLLRKAFRSGRGPIVTPAHVPMTAPEAVKEVVPPQPYAEVVAPVSARIEAPAIGKRRPWLAMVGLALALLGLLGEIPVCGVALQNRQQNTAGDWFGLAVFAVLMVVPIGVGLMLANKGEPGIGRRFTGDLVTYISRLRDPAQLAAVLRTSIGLALATALVAIPLMLILRMASIVIALLGLTVFSVVDPVMNVRRRSWWLGAILSAGTCLFLFAVLAATADALAPLREDALVFMAPMMLYALALGLSGLVRFFRAAR